MKKLLILSLLTIGCSNPLDKVYEPLTYRTDYRAILEDNPDNADKINFVIDKETPSIGATYQDILNRYPIIVEKIRIKDSIQKVRIRLRKEEQRIESLKKKRLRDSLNAEKNERLRKERVLYEKEKAKQRKIFISILKNYNIKEPFRSEALKEFDEEQGLIKINQSTIHINGWEEVLVDIGPKVIEIRTNDKW